MLDNQYLVDNMFAKDLSKANNEMMLAICIPLRLLSIS